MNNALSTQEYKQWLKQVKAKIRSAQVKAAIKVNEELLNVYWWLGEDLVAKQENSGWGSGFIDRLAKDLRNAFPGVQGFSRTNLYSIRKWYLAYRHCDEKVQRLVGQIPWGQNVSIINKLENTDLMVWYVTQTYTEGWTRPMLEAQIETQAHLRVGAAPNNFSDTLPPLQSELATTVLKDPYVFDFLTRLDDARERLLEDGLVDHIIKFMLELGKGFAFVGRQYHLTVGGQDYYVDLLFYHLSLRCFVPIELKAGAFKPEYAGKMNFYLSAIDDTLKHKTDSNSVGIILCKDKNDIVAEFALRAMSQPIGISKYELTKALPESLKYSLPTLEELENELAIELQEDRRSD